MHLQRVLACC